MEEGKQEEKVGKINENEISDRVKKFEPQIDSFMVPKILKSKKLPPSFFNLNSIITLNAPESAPLNPSLTPLPQFSSKVAPSGTSQKFLLKDLDQQLNCLGILYKVLTLEAKMDFLLSANLEENLGSQLDAIRGPDQVEILNNSQSKKSKNEEMKKVIKDRIQKAIPPSRKLKYQLFSPSSEKVHY